MAHKKIVFALILFAASPVSASKPEVVPAAAPAGTPDTRYCLRVEMLTGSILETVECWTREQWTDQDVDLDKEWPREGVALINDGVKTPVPQ